MSSATKQAVCTNCRQAYSYKPVLFYGEEIFESGLCEPCDRERLANNRREHEANERLKRLTTWDLLDLPLKDTNPARLPHGRSAAVMGWKYGPKGPFVSGASGSGKTRTAIQLCRRLWVDEAREFRFVPWHQWANELDKANRYGGYGMHKEIQLLYRWPFVVFDDVGKGKPTEHLVTAFFNVIDFRTSRGLPTAITTKYPLSREPGSPFEQRLSLGAPDAAKDVSRRLVENSMNFPFN